MQKQIAIALAVLTGAVGLVAAGCGSSSPPNPAAQASQTPAGAAFAFTRCMHAHGAEIPDPHVNVSGGQTSISQVMPASAAAAPGFKKALKACAYLQPGPQNNREGEHGPSKMILLAFARCLRAHGMSNFPDPNGQGRLTLQMVNAAGVDVRAPAFFVAARKCIGVTHGQVTMAQVAAAAHGPH
jgi:hypothetical protein